MPRMRKNQPTDDVPQELVEQINAKLRVFRQEAAQQGLSTEEYEAQLFALLAKVRKDLTAKHAPPKEAPAQR